MLEQAQVLRGDPQIGVPGQAGIDPVLVPLLVLTRLDEEFHLHLLEFAGAEDEIARSDLIAEALADLSDTERRLLARSGHHVREVHEDALRGLRTQIMQALLGFDRAEVGLEHHVEIARLGPFADGAAIGAADQLHGYGVGIVDLVLVGVRLLQVVLPVPLVAVQAFHQRIVEHSDVPRGHPHRPRQDDRGIQAHHIVAAGDHGPPPLLLDVLLELHTQRTVIPRRLGPSVDLAAGVYQTPALGEIRDGVDLRLGCHGTSSPSG